MKQHLTERYWIRPTLGLVLVVLIFAFAMPSTYAADCRDRSLIRSSGTFNLRVDNDLFGGVGQDQGYSNGILLSWVSPNLTSYRDDPCLPGVVRVLNRHLSFLQREGLDEQNMIIGLGQLMYTPADWLRHDLIRDDRPYVGALLFSLGYNARRGDRLRTSQLRVGLVGPAAQARQMQNWWHDVIGESRFHGWDHQLHNEAVVQLIHERRNRISRTRDAAHWGHDLTRHWGASLGNFATYVNIGAEWRFGLRLPDDFGTAPLRPAGENTSPVRTRDRDGWSGHWFVAVDARWVLRDITLDGNTFRSSHKVDKRPLVADIGYGIAIYRGHWRFAFARYHRTREFDGQKHVPVYGTVTVGRRF